jgi:hypothetical protein
MGGEAPAVRGSLKGRLAELDADTLLCLLTDEVDGT